MTNYTATITMKIKLMAAALLMTGGAATSAASAEPATDGLSYSLQSLVMMLAGEQACKMNYNPTAVERFVAEMLERSKGPVQDGVQSRGQIAPELPNQVAVAKYAVDQMTKSTLVAHCAQVRQTAKTYGFIP
jgi:hypothetical protein